jgi:thioredoxin reductase
VPVGGFFVGIGHIPNTALFSEKLDTDEAGYLTGLRRYRVRMGRV